MGGYAAGVLSSSRSAASPDPLAALLELRGVAGSVVAARAGVDRLLGHRILRQRSAEVSAESALRGARASAELAGASVLLADLRSGSSAGPVVAGAVRVSAAVGELAGTWERAPLQVLARLHVLAATGIAPRDELGRPGGQPRTTARLAALGNLVATGTGAPAVVLAAVVHGELRTLAPFGIGDGIIARAAARLVLISRGLDPKALSVPEVGHLELRQDYDDALAGYASGTADGVAAWLRHCCAAVELGAREGLAVCEALLRG